MPPQPPPTPPGTGSKPRIRTAIRVPPEQDEVNRLLKDVDALIDHGRWPRHLHWSV